MAYAVPIVTLSHTDGKAGLGQASSPLGASLVQAAWGISLGPSSPSFLKAILVLVLLSYSRVSERLKFVNYWYTPCPRARDLLINIYVY